jgi:two-component system chemotaxis response regulator CheB
MKKILLVDDSALMRRVFGDIIRTDARYTVADEAKNGLEALELLRKNTYDAVVLDVNMPQMDGIGLLQALRKEGIKAKILMASTLTMEGAKVTMDALDLGAMDFIHKPEWSFKVKDEEFIKQFMTLLEAVSNATVSSSLPHASTA